MTVLRLYFTMTPLTGGHRRRVQAEFIARGLRSLDEARRTGEYVDADVVVGELQRKLEAARARMVKTGK